MCLCQPANVEFGLQAAARRAGQAALVRDWRREPVPAELGALVEAKWEAQYWRSQHARAKQRAAHWQSRCRQAEHSATAAEQRAARAEQRVRELELENAGLQQRNRDLLQTPFGRRSERQNRPGADGSEGQPGSAQAAHGGQQRPRGGQRGAAAHPRVDRSGLPLREEVHEPGAERRQCLDCGQPYRRHGEQVSERVEVQVRGYLRRIRRPRYRAACTCARRQGQPVPEVSAPLEPALFRGSGYGLSVWVACLLQVYWQRHPARAFERQWWEACGVRLPAGTLLGHVGDFLTWFEPLEAAIGWHQQQARSVHGDETSWVIHARAEAGGNARCWLWACLSRDAVRLRVDPARSAEAAAELFGQLGRQRKVVLVCDRYAAYVRLQREHPEQFELAICWAHVRRDFVTLGRQRAEHRQWADGIVERIGRLYRRNAERLAQRDTQSALESQSEAFRAAQRRLEAECSALFEYAERELEALTAAAQASAGADPRLAPLQSLLRHRAGLLVFVSKPFVAMDNNAVERVLRRPVIGRKLSYGSHSENGAALQGLLLSVLATLDMAGVNLWRWLEAFLGECALLGPRAVVQDPQAWLPWGMSAARLRALQQPARHSASGPDP